MDIGHQTHFTLPPLPYPENALEPHISSRTLDEHHGAHHKAYVDKLNQLIEGTDYDGKDLDEIIKATAGSRAKDKQLIFNNAGQHWNHSFFWKCLTPRNGGQIPTEIEQRLTRDFGSVDKFKKKFVDDGVAQFGSGWVWLIEDGGKLAILKTPNAENPLSQGKKALLTCDVWEHAYYLDYQHERPKFLKTFIDHLANWDQVRALLG